MIKPLKDRSISRIKLNTKLNTLAVKPIQFTPSLFSLEAAESYHLTLVKHNMRFRVYNVASYNFSDLAQVYIQMHRLSEAKWYLLQSTKISREENDDKHTIANLVNLAMVKVDIGDKKSALADLIEARDLAHARAMVPETGEIERKMQFLQQNGTLQPKPDVKYAETADYVKKVF